MESLNKMARSVGDLVFDRKDEAAEPFERVLAKELEDIGISRNLRGAPAMAANVTGAERQARASDLAGLALSGGGIRSATFCLGVLQALAGAGLLKRFDYLSTVSGGGYIGSWLAAWIKRTPGGVADKDGHEGVETALPKPASGRAFDPREFIRSYSNYLAPLVGFFSADTWTIASIWLRNTVLNQLVIALFLSVCLMAPRILAYAMDRILIYPPEVPGAAAVLLLFYGVIRIAGNLRGFEQPKPRASCHDGQSGVVARIGVISLLSAWLFSAALLAKVTTNAESRTFVSIGFAVFFAGVILLGAFSGFPGCFRSTVSPRWNNRWCMAGALLFVAVSSAAVGAGLTLTAARLLASWAWTLPAGLWPAAVWGGPIMLFVFAVVAVFQIGLMGRWLPDDRREWWGRLGAWLAILIIGCTALAFMSIYGPLWVAGLFESYPKWSKGITLGWLATTAAGVLAGNSGKSGGQPQNAPRNTAFDMVAKIAPFVAIGGFLLALSTLLHLLLIKAASGSPAGFFPGWKYLSDRHWNLLDAGPWPMVFFVVAGAASLLLGWRIDVNDFSLHHFYKNRLVRCYLGASNRERDKEKNPFTGFFLGDDVPLASLRPVAKSGYPYVGPYPIVNAALNITHGERLSWQERKAASFVFTPRYCGYDGFLIPPTKSGDMAHAYRPTEEYAYPRKHGVGGIHLGTSMAISGAAASPNMGYHTSTAVAFLLTLFDVRLGWWLGNPRNTRSFRKSGPGIGLLYLLSELFGSADASSKYIYLSDGGHFENLAIYELVKRRCGLIVACDSEEDRNFTFGGLGNCIRKCRTDLGVDIDIDIAPLLDRDERGRTSTHILTGEIKYPNGLKPGLLVYVKSSMVKPTVHGEPTDALEYSMRCQEFPHQSTGDQFFDESQFESYRSLGRHIGELTIASIPKAYAESEGPTLA